MSAYNKFNQFVQDLANGAHNFSSNTFNVCLTNVAPVATNTVYANITDLTTGSGYTAGGQAVTYVSSSQTSGVEKYIASLANPTWTSTGTIGPFRYAVLYNFTQSSPVKPLIGWWDYGSAITLANTNTFTVSLDAVNGVFQIS